MRERAHPQKATQVEDLHTHAYASHVIYVDRTIICARGVVIVVVIVVDDVFRAYRRVARDPPSPT